MSRTLSQLTAGTVIHFNTSFTGTDADTTFIVMGESEQGNSVLLMPELVVARKRMNATDVAEYNGCEMDTYLSAGTDGFRSAYFSAALQACLVPTQIKCYSLENDTTITIERDIFIPSYTEMGWASDHDEGASLLPALKTYKNTTDDETARMAKNTAGTGCFWWMRSARSARSFRLVLDTGRDRYSDATSPDYWFRPLLSVAGATLVSDDTEDTIYLFPNSAAPYREVDAVIYMGSSDVRPKKARLITTVTNATGSTLQVSNNAKDENPVWVTVGADGLAEFANTVKTTDKWELGVKVYAKSGGRATIAEPVMMVEVDEGQ